jgi:hypothetical protein
MISRSPVFECPNCQTAADDAALECARCGVVFARWHGREMLPAAEVAQPVAPADRVSGPVRLAHAAGLVILTAWTIQFARLGVSETLEASVLHLPDLVFHEAGHVLFSVFGRFMTVLGGSLFQVLVPVICFVAFVRQRQPFGAVVCAWWAGQNLVDLAPYIADARALQLVLLGGHTGAEVEGHDWEFILTQLGCLHLDRALGLAAFRIGLVIMAGAIVWGGLITGKGMND